MPRDPRLYATFTLEFPEHHKIKPLSDKAYRTLTELIFWSRRSLTDGFIPEAMFKTFGTKAAREELMRNDPERPSVVPVGNGYQLHDFDKHQSTKEEVEAAQESYRERGRKGGRAKAANQQTASNDLATAKPDASKTPSQTYRESESERETETTPPVSMSSHLLKREAPQIDLEKVRAAVQARTGRTCTDMGIVRIIGTVMERAKQDPRDKTAYVVRAIDNDPFVWQQFIDEEGLSA